MRLPVFVLALGVLGGATASAQTLAITSPAFAPGAVIPAKFTCDAGRDAPNPALAFAGVPAKTQALVLIMDDPDVPKTMIPSGEFVHWLLWDLPATATGIGEGEGKGGINGMGRPGYMGPCPPDRSHRYFFRLYALDTTITTPIKTKAELLKAMEGHVLQQAELMGTYEREKKAPVPAPPPGGQAAAPRQFVVPGGGPEDGLNIRPPNGQGQTPAFEGQTRAPEQKLGVRFEVVTLTEGLANPWGLAFLPDGKMLVTERPGRLRVVSADGTTVSPPVAGLPPVDARGQGGLLDVALDPAFQKNRLIYWSYAEPGQGVNNTAVARGRFVDGAAPTVESVQVIFHQAPSLQSNLHFGGRLIFARDGTLFVTLGDRSVTPGRMQAQRLDGLLGKIVRINADGTIPKDNPFVGKEGVRPEIWSLGHRNIQSAALHPATGELWEVEHGTRGGDELNVSRRGLDYGWPTIAYGIEYQGGPITGGLQRQEGMQQPVYFWDPVIAPSGMLFYTGKAFPAWQNSLFIGGLGSTNLVRLSLTGDRVVGEERLLQDLRPQRERIRDVRQGPDGAIYLLTDSPKGRILKLVPRA